MYRFSLSKRGWFTLSCALALIAAVPSIVPTAAGATTCAIPGVCLLVSNSGTGPGIEGSSAGSYGVWGITTFNATSSSTRGYGVFGQDRSTNNGTLDYGVLGTSTYGIGTSGMSTYSYGVTGVSKSGYGSYGQSAGQSGVYGVTSFASPSALGSIAGVLGVASSTSYSTNLAGVAGRTNGGGFGVVGTGGGEVMTGGGVRGISTNTETNYGVYGTGYIGVYGQTLYNGTGVAARSAGGQALSAISDTGSGAYLESDAPAGSSSEGAFVSSLHGVSVDSYGGTVAVLARAPSGGYEFVAADSNGQNNVFTVDAAGNVAYHGMLKTFARAAGGRETTAYASKGTAPTLEDVGSAQLVRGRALVGFGAEFAASLDSREAYHVFLTPDGDTRGLFVAAKTARGFEVRETQGGRGSFAFDYRVVGTALGEVGTRSAFVERGREPGLPAVRPFPSSSERRALAPSADDR